MNITAWDSSGGPMAGFIAIKINDDEYSSYPPHITFRMDHESWEIEGVIYTDTSVAAEDLEPKLIRVCITARADGPGIAPDMIRVPKFGQARDEAIRQVSRKWRKVGDKFMVVEGVADPRTAKLARARKGKRTTDEDLVKAVNALQAAIADGRSDLTVAVAERLHLSTATAGRRIALARKRGLLED